MTGQIIIKRIRLLAETLVDDEPWCIIGVSNDDTDLLVWLHKNHPGLHSVGLVHSSCIDMPEAIYLELLLRFA